MLSLAPGQTRPLAFHISMLKLETLELLLVITYRIRGTFSVVRSSTTSAILSSRKKSEPHRITFLHPGGQVSYAIIRAPYVDPSQQMSNDHSLPILLNMHGAGVEADSEQVRHMLDSVPDIPAWIVFPAGATPWSGDDWRM